MQSISKNEVAWVVEALNLTATYYQTHSRRCAGMEAGLATLRAEQLTGISERLQKALDDGNKRIEIKY
jgi:hypothetical protein